MEKRKSGETEESLIGIGLTPYEAKAYLALVELSESKTGRLCERSGIPSSHIYKTLESLSKKGLVSHKYSNNVKVFFPNSPQILKEIYRQKEEDLHLQQKSVESTINALMRLPKERESFSDYKYFEGASGIKSLFLEVNSLLKPNTTAKVLSADVETWKKLDPFILDHHKARASKKVFEQMILPASGKHAARAREKIGQIEIRYLPHKNQAEFAAFEGFCAILYMGTKNPRGFLIKDELFTQLFSNVFDMLWAQAKK